ncbi:MAG: HAD hydrolase-like protein [Elusimicrobiota bacterium]|nr:HAD hydrolase-like protein [Elusimicrobiota bacterium]
MTALNLTSAAAKRGAGALERVISRVRERTVGQKSTLAIFDLDGTLFDNRTRTIFILREISEKFDSKAPQLAAAFENFRNLSIVDYSLDVTLRQLGVSRPAEIALIKQEWAKRFFSDNYQKYDMPIPGAKAYVERVHKAGATVIYLTGRDVGRMLVGTTEVLRLYGFPVGVEGTMTIVKKEAEQDDELFKREVSAYIDRLGEVVAIFENEPANSNILRARFPGASSFFVLTQHKPGAPALDPGIHRIKNFRAAERPRAV